MGTDLRRWRFEIAAGATFHDGSRVTADDVVWSLRRLRNLPNGEFRLPGIAASGIRKDTSRSIVIVTDDPNAEIPLAVRLQSFVFKEGERRPGLGPGCGPFKLVSYDDGDAVLARHHGWHGGDVPLDRIDVRLFADAEALTTAVLGGQSTWRRTSVRWRPASRRATGTCASSGGPTTWRCRSRSASPTGWSRTRACARRSG
jgi:peptide/nickel transport system substrate-binding protein